MKKTFKIIILCLISVAYSFVCCTTEEQPIVIKERIPGSITGLVKPNGIDAQVYLFQGIPVDTTVTDSLTGLFRFDDVSAGFYSIEIIAENYGVFKREEIEVVENGTTAIGEIHLRRIPEQISSILPWNNSSNVKLDENCVIEFTTIMDHSSVEGEFEINPDIEGNFEWSYALNQSVMEFVPTSKYKTNTQYTISLGTGAKTELGDTLKFVVRSKFTTEPLRIEAHLPENGSSDVSPNSTIYVRFNTEMNKTSASINISPIMEGVIKWQNNESYIFVPSGYFSTNTTYDVSIDQTNLDIDGHSLVADFTFSFSTEPLKIINVYPSDGATNVSRNTGIHIAFNTDVDQDATEDAFIVSPEIKGNFTWSDYSKFTFNPVDKLASDAVYIVTVNTNCKDLYGQSLPASITFTFRTSGD